MKSTVLLFIFLSGVFFAQDESLTNSSTIFACINPENRSAYILPLYQTALVGLVIPERADVTIYSQEEVTATVFALNIDANAGSYEANAPVMSAITGQRVLNYDEVCDDQMAANVGEEAVHSLLKSVVIPVGLNYMIELQRGSQDYFAAPDIKGVFAFTFGQNLAEFQILDLNGLNVQLSFPFMPISVQDRSYIIVGNKSFSIDEVIESTEFGNAPSIADSARAQSEFVALLGTPLQSIMQEANMHFYPAFGRQFTYLANSRLWLLPGAAAPTRDFEFASGSTLYSLSFIDEIPYFALDDDFSTPTATFRSGQFVVIRFDEFGHLIGGPNGGAEWRIPSWFVENH